MRESCGVFGLLRKRSEERKFMAHRGLGTVEKAFNDRILTGMGDLGFKIFFALKGLQHRGQESAGIAILNNAGVGHTRYSTTGKVNKKNIQPIIGHFRGEPFAISHNGNLINTSELKEEAEDKGFRFGGRVTSESSAAELEISDTRVIAALIQYSHCHDFLDALRDVLPKLQGAFSLVILYRDNIIGARDSLGIRPLCFGENDDYYAISSESCSLDHLNLHLIRDVRPGEMVILDSQGFSSAQWSLGSELKICIFEYIYFARPDSVIEGIPVNRARRKMGEYLAHEHRDRVLSDKNAIIVPVLDSGLLGALGVQKTTNLNLIYEALFRAHFTFGRTFIESAQDLREHGVSLKFNPILFDVQDKRVIVVDDSIVRGTTMPRVVALLRTPKELLGEKYRGAKEIDILVTAPPYLYPCSLGIDTWRRAGELIAANCQGDIDRIREKIGADYLGYLSLENTIRAVVESDLKKKIKPCNFCTFCFSGKDPLKSLEQKQPPPPQEEGAVFSMRLITAIIKILLFQLFF